MEQTKDISTLNRISKKLGNYSIAANKDNKTKVMIHVLSLLFRPPQSHQKNNDGKEKQSP